MHPNTVFQNLTESNFQAVKDNLKQRFTLINKAIQKGTKEAFEIDTKEGKINFIFYNKGTFMIQASPSNTIYVSIVDEISKSISKQPTKKIVQTFLKGESDLICDYYVGCDEAGAGETFGSMFLGCAIIPKKNLERIQAKIKGKNIRELTKYEVHQTYNEISSLFSSEIKIYQASKMGDGLKNILLDRGYIEIITKIIEGKSQLSVVIDDYGVKDELKYFSNSLKDKGIEVIITHKADEQYTACKAASLIARKARLEEIDENNEKHSFVNEAGQKISPGAGSASNENTKKYLIEFRKKFPNKEYPLFVRRKWRNVKDTDKNLYQKKLS